MLCFSKTLFIRWLLAELFCLGADALVGKSALAGCLGRAGRNAGRLPACSADDQGDEAVQGAALILQLASLFLNRYDKFAAPGDAASKASPHELEFLLIQAFEPGKGDARYDPRVHLVDILAAGAARAGVVDFGMVDD